MATTTFVVCSALFVGFLLILYNRLPFRQRTRMAKYIRKGLEKDAFENPPGYFDYRNGILAACANGLALSGKMGVNTANWIFRRRFPGYGMDSGYKREDFLMFFATQLSVSKRVICYVDRLHIRGVPALEIADRLGKKR